MDRKLRISNTGLNRFVSPESVKKIFRGLRGKVVGENKEAGNSRSSATPQGPWHPGRGEVICPPATLWTPGTWQRWGARGRTPYLVKLKMTSGGNQKNFSSSKKTEKAKRKGRVANKFVGDCMGKSLLFGERGAGVGNTMHGKEEREEGGVELTGFQANYILPRGGGCPLA